MKRSLWALVIAIPLVLLLATGFGADPNAVASPLLNKPAPAFNLPSLGRSRLALSSFRGHPLVLNFWASWCVSCKAEHGYLRDAYRSYSASGVKFVGILYQDRSGDARDFLHKYGGSWPALEDPGGQTAIDYGVVKVPETYFVDRHGIVRFKSTGPVTPDLLKSEIGRIGGKAP